MECTGHRYYVNPDDHSEGTDIRHDHDCEIHGVAVTIPTLEPIWTHYKVMAVGDGYVARAWRCTEADALRWFGRDFGGGYVLVGPLGEIVAR